jgi:hypothetical protein
MTKYRHIKPPLETDDIKRDQLRSCPVSGKRMYASEQEANAMAKHRMGDRESSPAQLRTYICLYCGMWHLTSKQA